MALILNGKEVADTLKQKIAQEVEQMVAGGIAEERHKRDSVKERVKEKAAKEQLETDSLPKNIVGVNVNFFIPAVFPEEKT